MNSQNDEELVERARISLSKRNARGRTITLVAVAWLFVAVTTVGWMGFKVSQSVPLPLSPNHEFTRGLMIGAGLSTFAMFFLVVPPIFFILLFRRAEGVWRLQELIVRYHDQLKLQPPANSTHSTL